MGALPYRGRVSRPATAVPPARPEPEPLAPVRGARGPAVGRALVALLVALVASAGIGVTWAVFVGTEHGQAVDQASLDGAHIGQNRLWEVAGPVLDVVSVGFIAAAVLGCAAIAVVRRRWGLAVVAAVVLGGANLTTRVLKVLVLDRPELGHGPEFNTLPSGHTTAAASVAAALLLVVPPRVRPWVAVLGAGYAGATGVSTLVGQWHRPSDVVAGLLVVLAWGAVGCALLALGGEPAGERTPPTAAVRTVTAGTRGPVAADRAATSVALALLGAVAVVAGVVAVVALRRTWLSADPVGGRAELLTSYGGGALGIVAVAAASSAVLLLLRRAATAGSAGAGRTS